MIVTEDTSAVPVDASFGLRSHVLSPMETLAQSVSAIAPSTSAALTIPLVFALAGNGTCLAYVLAMLGMVLVAVCITVFARQSASPGSLYIYAQIHLPPFWAAVTAWSLCFAYIFTASSVIGGFTSFGFAILGPYGHHVPAIFLAALAAASAIYVAYRDIQISARIMLGIEAASVLFIALVVAVTLWRHGLHIDMAQLRLHDVSPSSVRLGVLLAVFSFVGFESATSLGTEARDPLRSIPRAVIWSTLLSGIFFVACAYGEVLGFHGAQPGLADSTAPLRELSTRAGLGILGPLIDAGVLVSMFAATLAFVISLARLLMLMARHGLVGASLANTNQRHKSPALGGVLVGVLAFVPVAVLLSRGTSGAEVYGYMGSLAVFGYLAAYALVGVAVLIKYARGRQLSFGILLLAVASVAMMLAAAVGTLFPVPASPYRYFPIVYAAFMLVALSWHTAKGRSPRP